MSDDMLQLQLHCQIYALCLAFTQMLKPTPSIQVDMHSSSVITISYLIHHIGLIRHSVNASYASSLRYSSHLPASVENLVVERRRNTIAGCLLKLMHLLNARKKKITRHPYSKTFMS